MLSDVLSILNRHISRYLFLSLNFLLIILHRNPLLLIGHSIAPILYSFVKLLLGLDLSLTGHQIVLLNKIILPLPVYFSILNNKPFNIGIFRQYSSKQLYFRKFIKGLPAGLFLHALEVSEILSPIFEGVVIFVLLD